jgi:sugar/nucleoside kinase (ribokinase family)
MDAKEYDVLAVGEINVDLIMAGVPRMPEWGTEVLATGLDLRLGGSTANMACACAALGMKTALAAFVGEDAFGDLLMDELAKSGVDGRYVGRAKGVPTGLTVAVSSQTDRAFVTALGAIDYLRGADVSDEALAATRHVHIGSYFLQSALREGAADVVARAKACGATVSLDPGYDPSETWDDGLQDLVGKVDVFLPNEVEARAIAGNRDVERAAKALAARGTLAVVKLGVEGACACDGQRFSVEEGFTVEVADTTACGDAFNAGFLQGWLAGRPVEECLRLGNAAGALMATVTGNDARVLDAARVAEMAGVQR